MFGLNKGAVIALICFISAALFMMPSAVRADEWNLTTRFTVNQPFQVPGLMLEANTPYVIRLLDSPSTRNVVQIYNGDQTKMLTMFMGVSDERQEPADKTVFTFIEMAPGAPLPIKEWFYPGRLHGLEFVYPKEQAQEIATHAQEPVLAASVGDLHDLASVSVEAIGPVGSKASASETAVERVKPEGPTEDEQNSRITEEAVAAPAPDQDSAAEQAEPNELGLTAQNEGASTLREQNQEAPNFEQHPDAATPSVNESEPVTEAQPSVDQERELPRTAGESTLLALIGSLCVGAGFALKRAFPGAACERRSENLK